MNWLAEFMKLLELKARYFFGIWIFGALLVFLPDDFKSKMAIQIPEVVKPWIGFASLAAFVLWLVLILIQAFTFVRSWFRL